MAKKLDFDEELKLLEDNLNWLVEFDGLSKETEAFYRTYVEQRKLEGDVNYTKEKWNLKENRRHGANSIRGVNSEMLFESVCYLAQVNIEERVTDEKRQTYGEDFVVVARKVSVKTRKHIPSISANGKPDTELYFYREDFRPAVWRVDILAVVDPDAKIVTTLDYCVLTRMLCDVDEKGFCTPKFLGNYTTLRLSFYEQQTTTSSHTINLVSDLKERKLLKEINDDKNN